MRKHSEINRENCRFVIFVHQNSITFSTTLWLDGKNYPENYKRKFALLSNSFEKKIKQDFNNNNFWFDVDNWICVLDMGDDNNVYENKERNRIKINYEIMVYRNTENRNLEQNRINEILDYFINSDLFQYFQNYQYVKN